MKGLPISTRSMSWALVTVGEVRNIFKYTKTTDLHFQLKWLQIHPSMSSSVIFKAVSMSQKVKTIKINLSKSFINIRPICLYCNSQVPFKKSSQERKKSTISKKRRNHKQDSFCSRERQSRVIISSNKLKMYLFWWLKKNQKYWLV